MAGCPGRRSRTVAPVSARVRRRRALAVALLLLVTGSVAFLLLRSGDERLVPAGGDEDGEYDPLAWDPDRQAELERRAAAGLSDILYEKSPGGVVASARRTAVWRPLVESAARASGVDPDTLEAIVFLESAGRPDAVAGGDLEGAVGLAQILASTATDLLDLRVDLARSEDLTERIATARALGDAGEARRLARARRRADERFDPPKALRAAGRYLAIARREAGRDDLAVASYHMGLGNLQTVLDRYGEGDDVPYARLYFDTTPLRNERAYSFISRLGDDTATYLWRVRAAQSIMRLHRERPAELARRAAADRRGGAAARRLRPATGPAVPLPGRAAGVGLRLLDPGDPALRPSRAALSVLLYLGAGTKAISGQAPLVVASADGPALGIARRYRSREQALAFEFMLDRLQAWNLIAWERGERVIEVAVAAEAGELLPEPGRLLRDALRQPES